MWKFYDWTWMAGARVGQYYLNITQQPHLSQWNATHYTIKPCARHLLFVCFYCALCFAATMTCMVQFLHRYISKLCCCESSYRLEFCAAALLASRPDRQTVHNTSISNASRSGCCSLGRTSSACWERVTILTLQLESLHLAWLWSPIC